MLTSQAAFKRCTALLQPTFLNVTFPSTLQLFLLFFATRFEVLTLVRIHNAVWVRTPHSLVVMNVLEEHSASTFTGHQKTEAVCPDQNLGTHQSVYMVP
jgi:hypothetical protein